MNAGLNYQVRQGARNIRSLYADEAGLDAMREAKQEALRAIYQILCIHLGTPPAQFDWQWKDKDGEFHRDGEMTPLAFAEKYITTPMEDYVCLVNDPPRLQPAGPHLHRPVPGQRGGRHPHNLPERGHRPDEGHRHADAPGRYARLDGL